MKTTVPFHPPLKFHCSRKVGEKVAQWDGFITRLTNYGSHYDIQIESRSGFHFIIGSYENGGFISIPDYQVGSDLASYNDYFWNNERLSSIMNKIDATTVASALQVLSENNYI